jgi:hypothetical protein
MIEIFNYDQNSLEWLQGRAGLWTCSNAKVLLMKGRGGGESETRKKLLYTTAGEIITGKPTEGFSNANTERGHDNEGPNRDLYAFIHDVTPEIVGFVRNGRMGGSPDAFIGSDGILECKNHQPSILIPMILADEFPEEHMPQCQALLMVCEREWVDVSCYWPDMPLFVKRTYRDEEYIKKLRAAVDQFNDELDALVEKLRNYSVAA